MNRACRAIGRLVLVAVLGAPLAGPLVRCTAAAVTKAVGDDGMRGIPAGSYRPLFRRPARDSSGVVGRTTAPPIRVPAFRMAAHAVTNAEFLAFVREHPEWGRSRASKLFVDESYLRHWKSDLDFGDPAIARSPVVHVSWFAAKAYCAWRGHRLPTVDQWEYVATASETRADATRDPAFQDRLRAWYSQRTPERLPNVGSTYRNVYGIWDMHGLVWEWTADFSSALVNGESRGDAALDRSLFCGSGATNAADFRDYAAFMRYAFRSSLSARYCVGNLGFREAADAPAPAAVSAARTP